MTFRLPFVPTARTAWIAAGAAPLAVLLGAAMPGAWVFAPAGAAALFMLVLFDAFLAGDLSDWNISAPHDTEVGRDTPITITAQFASGTAMGQAKAALQLDQRLSTDGRAIIQLNNEDGAIIGRHTAVPSRRGTGRIDRAWLRWTGPLGFGARQAERELDVDIRVWPDLSPVRSSDLQTFLRDAQIGLIARRLRGEGTQFEALSEYEPGMDRRWIDWKASARHSKLYARENEAERNNQIVFAFDCGQAMCEPVDGLPRIDRTVSAALTCGYVALKGGDKVSLFGFAARPGLMTPFISNARAFHRLQSSAAQLDYHSVEPNFTLALATLTSKLKRRSLIVLFSDFTDPTAAELMVESLGRLVKHHLVLFVTISDAEIEGFVSAEPGDIATIARSVTADTLARQRAVVLERLRRMGVDVIDAPWDQIGPQLIDRYYAIKRQEAIG